MPDVHKFFVYPAADDGGTPVGAALEGYHRLCRMRNVQAEYHPLNDLYYGQEFEKNQIEKIVRKSNGKYNYRYIKTGLEAEIAKMISRGKIIARFSGRDEWGPRALGNRSILADARDMRIISKLNFAVKQRDFWMPFAPVIIGSEKSKYLINAHQSNFMIEAFDTKKKGEEIIAGLHPFDRTCRPQTVSEENPKLFGILKEYQKITGVSGLINTSFNLHGFPIVGNPEVAISTFINSGIDALILEDYLLEK
jgi:carbamoyltransferase